MLQKTMFYVTAAMLLLAAGAAATQAQNPAARPSPYDPTVKINYVRTWDAIKPMTDANAITSALFKEAREATQYFDGLGRPLQAVVKKGSLVTDPSNPLSSANAVDMVAASVYDEFGREQYKYLSFAANSTGGNTSISDGLFKFNPFQQQLSFADGQYPNDTFFYGKANFEASPLNRVLEVYAPGDSWAGSEANVDASTRRSVATQYMVNEASDSVRIWTITSGSFSTSAVYAAGTLYKNVTIDEHKNKVIEYKDRDGKLILKKIQISASPSGGHYGWLCTYYAYDDTDLLRGVLQPQAVDVLLSSSWSMTTDILNELCFRYEYDSKNRMIVKKAPGAGEVRAVYDKWDRVVLTQDANLRSANKWLFTKYDQLNRPIMTGFYVNSTYTTQSGMQSYLDGQNLGRYENYQTASFPLYSLTLSFPSVTYSDLLTITYYDDYSWAGWYGSYTSKDNSWDSEFATASNSTWPYPQPLTQSGQTRGMVTGVWQSTGSGLLTASYYDDHARLLQTKSYNYTGGIDILTTQYSFAGQVLQTILRHEKGGTNAQTHIVQTKNSYDEAGRLIQIEKKLSSTIGSTTLSQGWHTIASLQYNALGQLKKKTLASAYGTSGLDTLTNAYNIRGWLTSINKGYITGSADAWFGMELGYDKDGYATFANKQFNGNISAAIWRTRGDGEKRKYDFGYDAANRLLKADFTQAAGSNWDVSAGIDFSMKMGDGTDATTAYDANGNIKKMWQRGWKLGGSVTIDSLIYKSNDYSNKLKYVRDGANDPDSRLGDFKESSANNSDNLNSNTADYSYDGNGNMTVDNNKSISSITYNHLNLPDSIVVTGKGSIKYVYDATGNKLKKIVHETGNVDKTTTYIGPFIYENDTLQLLQHEEGRIRLAVNTSYVYASYAFDYFEKDHLGNVRVLLTEERDTASYPEASMETANLGRDSMYYSKIPNTRIQRSSVSGYPSNDTYTNPNDWVAKVSGSGNKVGPGIVLKVMTGDKFNIRVSSWYRLNGASPQTPNSPLTDLIAALVNGLGGAPNSKATASQLSATGVLNPEAISYYASHNTADSTTKPKAFLNWVLFDEQLKYVSSSSGFEQVPAESVYGNGGGSPSVYVHQQNGLVVNKTGYLYIYVSNETPNIDVFFDNLQVTHMRSPLLEESHYYPFGLIQAGISSKSIDKIENKKRFNGIENTTEFELNIYDAFYRQLDPQLGRWHTLDPRSTDNESLYSAMGNNPILYTDAMGDSIPKRLQIIPTPQKDETTLRPLLRKVASGNDEPAVTLTISKGAQGGVNVGPVGVEANWGSKDILRATDLSDEKVDPKVTKKGFAVNAVAVNVGKDKTEKTERVTGPNGLGADMTTYEVTNTVSIGLFKTPIQVGLQKTDTYTEFQAFPETFRQTGTTGTVPFAGYSVSPSRDVKKHGTTFSIAAYYKIEINVNLKQVAINFFDALNTGH